jgi:hypothetical protein
VSADATYVRLTKIRELSGPPSGEQRGSPAVATTEGTDNHHISSGYVVDGWFLDPPRVGHSMVLLRFRRNSTYRLGLFTSSQVTVVGETEIYTSNSVYRIEYLSFEQHPGTAPSRSSARPLDPN